MHAPDALPLSEALLRERAWIHGLARHLVRDDTEADDLAQETWRAALERPPADRRALQGWIARVMYRLAARGRRGVGRRRRRERLAARAESVPSTAALVAEAELHRRLVDAVLALDEPYRSAVLARYVHGLTPRELALRGGEPVKTIASRLHRGLAMLRARLDAAGQGDRRAWAVVVAIGGVDGPGEAAGGPTVGGTTGGAAGAKGGAATVAVAGGLGMATATSKLGWTLAAVVLALGLGAVAWNEWGPAGDDASEPSAPVPVSIGVRRDGTLDVAPSVSAVPAPPVDGSGTRTTDVVAPRNALAWRVRGAVVHDATSAPVPRALVHVLLERGASRRLVATAVADDLGEFEVPMPLLGSLGIVARRRSLIVCEATAPGGLATRLDRGGPVNGSPVDAEDGVVQVRVRLRPGGVAHGRVLAPDGSPVRGAELTARASSAVARAVSGDDGAFRIAIPGDGRGSLEILAVGVGSALSPVDGWALGQDTDLGDLRLRGAGVITGRVEYADGSPAGDVPVGGVCWVPQDGAAGPGADGLGHATTRTDRNGQFRLGGLAAGRWRLVAPGDGRSPQFGTEVSTGADDARLVIDGCVVRVTWVDGDGAPVSHERFRVRWGEGAGAIEVSGEVGGVDVFVVPAGATVVATAALSGGVPPSAPVVARVTVAADRRETLVELREPSATPTGRFELAFVGVPPPFPTFTLRLRSRDEAVQVLTWKQLAPRPVAFDVPCGTYVVQLEPDDVERSGRVHAPVAAGLVVEPGRTAEFTPTFVTGGRIRLRLVPAPPGARIAAGEILPPGGGPPIVVPGWRVGDAGPAAVAVDATQSFAPSIAAPVGTCAVRLRLATGEEYTGLAEVREGLTTEVDLERVPR